MKGVLVKTDLLSSGSVFKISKIGALASKRCASILKRRRNKLELQQQHGMEE